METLTLPAPVTFDGWFLALAIEAVVGVPFHLRLSFNAETRELIINVTGLTQEQKDLIPPVVASYVDPGDTTKNLSTVVLAGYAIP